MLLRLVGRADALCGRLNAGLVAFAIVLLCVAAMAWMARHPEMFKPDYDAAAAAAGMTPDEPAPDAPLQATSATMRHAPQ